MAHLISHYHSDVLERMVKAIVFIPEDAQEENACYPTLYLLHDQGGGAEDWSLNSNAERYAQENKIALVMPAGENSGFENVPQGDLFGQYMAEELPVLMEAVLPLRKSSEYRFVGGCGTGNAGAHKLMESYPGSFNKVIELEGDNWDAWDRGLRRALTGLGGSET